VRQREAGAPRELAIAAVGKTVQFEQRSCTHCFSFQLR
jgi:hypothetical protein